MKKQYIIPLVCLATLGVGSILPPLIPGSYGAMSSVPKLGFKINTSRTLSQEIVFGTLGGSPKVLFSVSVNAKGVITSVEIKNKESDKQSLKYIKKFQGSVKKAVIGKSIKTLQLGVIGGASVTTRVFGEFIRSIGGNEKINAKLPNGTYTNEGNTSQEGDKKSSKEIQVLPKKIERLLEHASSGGTVQIHVIFDMDGEIIRKIQTKIIQTNRSSSKYIKDFTAGISKGVVGKNIREIQIETIGGASQTSKAFQGIISSYKKIEYIPLHISVYGSGSVGFSGDINANICTTQCTYEYQSGSSIVLEGKSQTGYTLEKWAGTGSSFSGVTINGKQLTIHPITKELFIDTYFKKEQIIFYGGGGGGNMSTGKNSLSISVIGNGLVTSAPGGINCGSTCSGSFDAGSSVTLTATPASGFGFKGWGGICSGSNPICLIPISQSANVTAEFESLAGVNTVVEQIVPYNTPGGTTQVQFRVTYDVDRILQSIETTYISGDSMSQTLIGSFHFDAGTYLVGQSISSLQDIPVFGGASLTTAAFKDFIRSI